MTDHVNVYKLWEQTPVNVSNRNNSDRPWQVKLPEKEPVITAKTIPLFGANPVRGRQVLSDRNLRRVTSKVSKPEKFFRKLRNYK